LEKAVLSMAKSKKGSVPPPSEAQSAQSELLECALSGGASLERPYPPDNVCAFPGEADEEGAAQIAPIFERGFEVETWARRLFIDGAREQALTPFWNSDHEHLKSAFVGVLWTNVPFSRGSEGATEVLGQCRIPSFKGDKWSIAFQKAQYIHTFGMMPDFIITLFGPHCAIASDREFCALVEHEYYHAGQKRDEFGEPMFGKDDKPKWAMRQHDIEQLTPITGRYGPMSDGERLFMRTAFGRPSLWDLFDDAGAFAP
jgi:hypothetical protein